MRYRYCIESSNVWVGRVRVEYEQALAAGRPITAMVELALAYHRLSRCYREHEMLWGMVKNNCLATYWANRACQEACVAAEELCQGERPSEARVLTSFQLSQLAFIFQTTPWFLGGDVERGQYLAQLAREGGMIARRPLTAA